jgi:juvenile hormone epoxide hydrolase
MANFKLIGLGIFCLLIAYFYDKIARSLPPPDLDFEEYWGRSSLDKSTRSDESIRKFEISFSQEKVEKLAEKLSDVGPFTEPLEGVAFEYGFNSRKLKEILKYWKDDYVPKWSQREKILNKFPQFKTRIQGLDIHFIHAKASKVAKDVKVFPILLLHGWPSSAFDFHEMIPNLMSSFNGSVAFDVVAPSLPGFGFSEGSARPGLAPEKIAVVLRNLMLRLKYEKFYVHGGDWVSVSFSTLFQN